MSAHTPPDWVRYAVWWQVFPLGFVGAEDVATGGPVEHRLGKINSWLDHLITLGANGLLLGPILSSMSHGYDTLDYFRIDPRLGDEADFDALITAAHERGIRVVMDGVFNHVGSDHPWVSEGDPRIRRSAAGELSFFEGHTQLVELDHDSDLVRDDVVAIMNHWLDRGIDGWRLDAAYTVPTQFWADVLPRVREDHPEVWFAAEVIQEDFIVFAEQSTVDSVTEYELWKATWSSLRDRNLYELDWTLGRHADMVKAFLPLNFVGNHDVTRLASQIPDPALRPHAAALLMFLPGVPSIYYGDEYGLEAVKEERLGGDDAIRPELPDAPTDVIDDGTLPLYRRLIALRRRHPWLVDATIEVSGLSNTTIVITATAHENAGDQLALALNLGDQPVDLPAGDVVEAATVTDGRLDPTSWAVVRPVRQRA